MEVKIFCGANAYACISENGRKTDIRLEPGKGAPASLREYAKGERERAARILAMADIAERAAAYLDKPAPDYIQAGERLWNGAIASHCMAMAYNGLTDRIAAFERDGRKAPESLLNGRHKLIAEAL